MKKLLSFAVFTLLTITAVNSISAESANIENFLKEQSNTSVEVQSQSLAEPRFLLDSLWAQKFGTTWGSDCWGWTAPDETDYAFFGIEIGIVCVNATTLQIVDTVTGISCLWQDIKTYDHYAYAVSECGSGLRVYDLQYLPDSMQLVGIFPTNTSGSMSSHNISIDTATGYLYAEGTASFSHNIYIHDLSNPAAPTYVGGFGFSPSEIHDMYALNDTVYVAEGNEGSYSIYNVTNKLLPFRIGYVSIPNSGYVHNIWPTEDRKIAVSTEETSNKTVKIWDVSDYTDVKLLSEYLAPNNLAHNAHVLGNFIYLSHYSSGVRIVDITNPSCPIEVAVYDKAGDNTWGVFPYTGSDSLVYSSNMDGTMYIFKLIPNPSYVLSDPDSDGVQTECDNCPNVANLDQSDIDQDSYGDSCDNCPSIPNDQSDIDGDDVGDQCDACNGFDDKLDADGDKVPDGCDICAGFDDNIDTDGDGVADGCDLCEGFDDANDYDGDGFPDSCDNCPVVFNPGQEDTSGDGIGDACCCVGNTGDINGNGTEFADILDLNYLVNYIFRQGPVPVCFAEGDVNNDSNKANILDLNYLVNYIFRQGLSPASCN